MASTDRQLLFGVLALQLELITVEQFVEACTIWATNKDRALSDLLLDRGWLHSQDKTDIDRLLARKVEKHRGDVAASLREAGQDTRVQQSLHSITDDEILLSLMPTPPPHGVALVATREFVSDGHERYTLSRLHAMGGIGRVWLAHDVALRREVALKELRPEKSSSDVVIGRFLREARITGQLEHPGIVPIYEVGRRPDDQAPYYTMRFIRGQTMAEAAADHHLRRKAGEATSLDLRKLLSSFVGVCNAVAYAHSRGVLHRDLKPQNIVLGAFGEVIVLDWGLAKVIDEQDSSPTPLDLGSKDGLDETQMGVALGTAQYMAPEQAAGLPDKVGVPADVFGLGAVLYHILTGQPPYPGKSKDATALAIECRPRPASDLASEVPPSLEAVCMKALSKKPENRYESALALADEVQHWLADEPVSAYPEPVLKRASRWMRRHKTFTAAAAVFLVCSTLALAGATAMIWREQQRTERDLARTYSLVKDVMATADTELVYQNTLETRRKLIERGLRTINEIHADRPNDGSVAGMLGEMQRYLGTVQGIRQEHEKAAGTLRESIALLKPLVDKFPNDDALRTSLTRAHLQLSGALKNSGKRREAIAEAEQSIAICNGPAARGDLSAGYDLAMATNEVAVNQFGFLPMETTEKTCRRLVELLRGIIEKGRPRESAQPRLLLMGTLWRIANCKRELGKPIEGLSALDDAETILQRLSAEFPDSSDVKHFRGVYWMTRGRTLGAIPGKDSETLDAFEKAIGTWTTMGAGRLDRSSIQLAVAYARRADHHMRNGRRQEAERDLALGEKTLDPIAARSGGNIEYQLARALTAAARTRLALGAKDLASIQKHFNAAQSSYRTLLGLDPDNALVRQEFERLEAEVKPNS